MNNRYGVGDFVKIKSDYFSMLELMVLRSQPNPNSTIVYKLQKIRFNRGDSNSRGRRVFHESTIEES